MSFCNHVVLTSGFKCMCMRGGGGFTHMGVGEGGLKGGGLF